LPINTTHTYAFHVDSSALADGTYELVHESESEQQEANRTLTEVVEDPNQSSKEHEASFAQESKPRSMNPIFHLYTMFLLYVLMHLCS
jgi:hypothetical protein